MDELFYQQVEETLENEEIIKEIKYFSKLKNEEIYIINKPLGKKGYKYNYEENVLVILRPKYKILFLDIGKNQIEFDEYYEDFLVDVSSISDKFEYKEHIGRPRSWKKVLTEQLCSARIEISDILESTEYKLSNKDDERKCELIISLLIGSINDIGKIGINEPKTLLEKVKNKILLFDGEQTRFIYKDLDQKVINIQGLSGTGKTELLLHKLKEIYVSTDSKIFFTCHNKVLASSIRTRIRPFFDFMKVEKQIEWDDKFWISYAWGSASNKNSGLYSFLCDFYGESFQRYSRINTFEKVCDDLLEKLIKQKDSQGTKFKCALDYIFIDESQDFSESFFKICELVTSKQLYVAGDVFQNIFEDRIKDKMINADFILNRCYRTDPRTFMFAQGLGMGLFEFESQKYNWLEVDEWEKIGYEVEKNGSEVCLSRKSIRRFEDLNLEETPSVEIQIVEKGIEIIKIIEKIKEEHPAVEPHDIAIVYLDNNSKIYESADKVSYLISNKLGWDVNKGHETKIRVKDHVFISNKNNIKGLEFPFVICITEKLQNDLSYRNTIYTMLSRSFIKSYLLFKECDDIESLQKSLKTINSDRHIKTIEPSDKEKENIKRTIIEQKEKQESYQEFLEKVLESKGIDKKYWEKFIKMIETVGIEKFNEEKTSLYIERNEEFL